MKQVLGWVWMLALAPVAVALAQEDSTAADVMDAVAADTAQGGAVPDEAAEVEPIQDEITEVETVSVDTGEAPPDEPAEPWRLYAGVDKVGSTLSISGLPPTAENEFHSGLYRLRAGKRFGDNINVELHYGIQQPAERADEVATERYYGVYLVPSTNLFDAFDLQFPVGYARSTVEGVGFDSLAFGLNAELPVQYYFESLPDLRLSLGWMTYYQSSDARLYGFNFGLRFDFEIGG